MKKLKQGGLEECAYYYFLIAIFTSPLFGLSPFVPDVNDYGFFNTIENTLDINDEIDIFWLVLYFLFPVIIFYFLPIRQKKRIAIETLVLNG